MGRAIPTGLEDLVHAWLCHLASLSQPWVLGATIRLFPAGKMERGGQTRRDWDPEVQAAQKAHRTPRPRSPRFAHRRSWGVSVCQAVLWADVRVRRATVRRANTSHKSQGRGRGQSESETACQVAEEASHLGITAFAYHPNIDPASGSVGGPSWGSGPGLWQGPCALAGVAVLCPVRRSTR